MMTRVLTLSGLLALGAAQDATPGLAGCPCLAEPPTASFIIPDGEDGAGLLRARPDGENVIPYPVSYGTLCTTHDVATTPYCAFENGTATPDAADWCTGSWCWVDPANCDTGADPSSYFHVEGVNATLFYSYATCASENTFTDSELDAQACNEEHSEVIGAHCTSAVQEDVRCPCVDWADSPDTRAQFENADGTALIVPLGDPAVDYTYALGYGSGACAAHDASHAPYCSDVSGAPLADAPDWCQSSWCWVDPDNCQLAATDGTPIPAVASSYFHRDGQNASRYYSYETCQHSNTFSDTDLDPQACNDEHSEVIADHCLTAGHQAALESCPCIATPVPHPFAIADSDPPTVTVTIGNTTFPYPAGYGMVACAPHDQLQAPSCANADGSVLDDAPSWCASNWCFVDPAACTGVGDPPDVAPSSYFHVDGQDPTFHYSYATCSHENTFTNSAEDDQACNADHSEVADWCTPPAGAVAAEITLDIDMPAGAELITFKDTFKADMAAALDGVTAEDVIITGVQSGSVVVNFYIAPAADGTARVTAEAVTAVDTISAGTVVFSTAPAVTAAATGGGAGDGTGGGAGDGTGGGTTTEPEVEPEVVTPAASSPPAPAGSGAASTVAAMTLTVGVALAGLQ